MAAPKVFLSHATEDKERFVLAFATALRAAGIEAWLDVWEILPGDSLVTKIFTEGLDEADAVIVVVSDVSRTKAWVEEELNAAVVKRIEEQSRLIPVILDGLDYADIPVPLRSLLQVRVDLGEHGAIEEAVRQVAEAVHGVHLGRPPVGAVPDYVADSSPSADGLGVLDSQVLRAAGEEAVRDGGLYFDTKEFVARLAAAAITESAAVDCLEVLDHEGLVSLHRVFGSGLDAIPGFHLTTRGVDRYLHAYVFDYETMLEDVCLLIANGPGHGTDAEIVETLGYPVIVVQHVLELLDMNGLLNLSRATGPSKHYVNVSPALRRKLVG